MFYLLYGILYLISLLPFFVLYRFSDGLYFIMCYVIRYRKSVVMGNLAIAFPQKTIQERKKIAKGFYRNFCDYIIESIKLLSMSDKQFDRRVKGDFSIVDKLAREGKNIQIHGGHQFNFEYCNLVTARNTHEIPFVGVYMPITNKFFDKVIYKVRSRYGTQLISRHDFKKNYRALLKQRYVMTLGADQNPGFVNIQYWLNFFGKKAPFVMGPDKGAVTHNLAVVFLQSKKPKRGYYVYECTEVVTNACECSKGELTLLYRDFLEKVIREEPSNYLWSHKRWKHEYKDEYKDQWIDI
jgi:KDO2-lipid IV(A) lauroyltransferase